jgi:hypothetical protein
MSGEATTNGSATVNTQSSTGVSNATSPQTGGSAPDPSANRLAGANFNTPTKAAPLTTQNYIWQGDGTVEEDWRVRISVQPAIQTIFYTYPLVPTNGVIFPYTPAVTINHVARYGTSQLTHSNYSSYFYEGSEVQNITINGDFTVQNIEEGQYLMAAIQFFRSCTKMFYGASQYAGTPPPMVFLNGYGGTYLPNVPCVITQFSHTMPADVDYVNIPVLNMAGPSTTRLPTNSTLAITLQPVYSRNNVSRNFTVEGLAQGEYLNTNSKTSGGFI